MTRILYAIQGTGNGHLSRALDVVPLLQARCSQLDVLVSGPPNDLPLPFPVRYRAQGMGFVFGKLGIVPEACSTWFLPRLVGLEKALEWCLTAELIDADAALAGGLVRSIHEPDVLLAEAEAFARKLITDRSPTAIALTKHMLRRNAAAADPASAHAIESLAMFYTSQRTAEKA